MRLGDERAFEAVYERHHRGILAFCRHMLGTREEAEDVVQHTFIAAYRSLLADEREIQLKAWLYAIARNRCLSVLRARRDQVALDDDASRLDVAARPSAAGLAAEEEVERRHDLQALLRDLQALPDDQRAALVLAELGAHSHDEIATVLGVRRDKVKALVFQARESLMHARRARETDCRDIRRQLATLRGGSLRRGTIRRHVAACPGCHAYREELRKQRAALAIVLPVVPSSALEGGILGGLGGGGAAAGAGTAGGAAAGGAGAIGAGAGGTMVAGGGAAAVGLGVKGMAAKVFVAAAVAGVAGTGGYVVVDSVRGGSPGPAPAGAASSPEDRERSSVVRGGAASGAQTQAARVTPAVARAPLARAGVPHSGAGPGRRVVPARHKGSVPGGQPISRTTPAGPPGTVPAPAAGTAPAAERRRRAGRRRDAGRRRGAGRRRAAVHRAERRQAKVERRRAKARRKRAKAQRGNAPAGGPPARRRGARPKATPPPATPAPARERDTGDRDGDARGRRDGPRRPVVPPRPQSSRPPPADPEPAPPRPALPRVVQEPVDRLKDALPSQPGAARDR